VLNDERILTDFRCQASYRRAGARYAPGTSYQPVGLAESSGKLDQLAMPFSLGPSSTISSRSPRGSKVEARITRNGKLLYARTFANGDDTLEWAEDERVDLLVKGWGLPLTMRDR
jgi:hypothetical protein